MKACIMCGGKGTRLKPLTSVRPKPMVKLLNTPVAELLIRRLITLGIREIYLSVGYMADEMGEFIRSRDFDADITIAEEKFPLGTAGGVKNCIANSDEPFFVLSGDNLFDFDLTESLAFHQKNKAEVTVLGILAPDPREYGVICADESGFITSFIEKPDWEHSEGNLINTGIYIISPQVLSMIPNGRSYDFSNDLFPQMLMQNKRLMCHRVTGHWGDMGEADSFIKVQKELLQDAGRIFKGQGEWILQDKTDENQNRLLAPLLIGSDCRLGENNRIGPGTVLGNGVCLQKNSSIEGSCIGDDCKIGENTDMKNSILDEGSSVGDNCALEELSVVGANASVGRFCRLLPGTVLAPFVTTGHSAVLSGTVQGPSAKRVLYDTNGLSGEMYSEITLTDALKIGQALASVSGVKRIGVGHNGTGDAEVYKNVCVAGIQAGRAICYDFEEMFEAQSLFYASYCSLDAFAYIKCENDRLTFLLYGKNGLPLSLKAAGAIGRGLRFSDFPVKPEQEVSEVFRMNLLSTAYLCALLKEAGGEKHTGMTAEGENPCLIKTAAEFFGKTKGKTDGGEIQVLFHQNGADCYFARADRMYSSDRVRSALCETELANGKTLVVPESADMYLEQTAKRLGGRVLRAYGGAGEIKADAFLADSLFMFDALFLCARLIRVLGSEGLTLNELCETGENFAVRRLYVDLPCTPDRVKQALTLAGARKEQSDEPYYTVKTQGGEVKLRQLGNLSRIKMMVRAAHTEAAKELSGQITEKLMGFSVDKNQKK